MKSKSHVYRLKPQVETMIGREHAHYEKINKFSLFGVLILYVDGSHGHRTRSDSYHERTNFSSFMSEHSCYETFRSSLSLREEQKKLQTFMECEIASRILCPLKRYSVHVHVTNFHCPKNQKEPLGMSWNVEMK
ncbi:CLUMA_CG011676, isoform A [Clunio marinus]|uniref:CLUMA_CG011676, isoform A n=1 Tax=Clunio marinus TaxID=568069 RepID=A0A1J1IEX1_9DIPT|nr:CLUMA_CG011676, isoform A [Clunio marinus]